MTLFDKKEAVAGQEKSSLIDMIQYMKKQGYPDEQITDYLQTQGYKNSQIFDTMSQLEMKGEQNMPISGPPPLPQEQNSLFNEERKPDQQSEQKKPGNTRFEEITEAIIEEKWSALMKDVDKIIAWKERTEERVLKVEQQIKNLKDQFDKLHEGVLGQISQYSEGLSEIGTDVKALSEVFKKTLPAFTQNISELEKITKKLKSPNRK